MRHIYALVLAAALMIPSPAAVAAPSQHQPTAGVGTQDVGIQAQHPNAYISSYWNWSGSGFWNVDQHTRIDEKAQARFWANQFWWTGTSTTGYAGLQTQGHRFDATIGDTAIFSLWNANAARGTSCASFTGGYSCRLVYPLTVGRLYRLRIWRLEADAGGQWWGAWVKDEATGIERAIGGIRLPANHTTISTTANYVQYFGAQVGCSVVSRSTAVFTQPAANHRGGGVYDFGATYSRSTLDTCITGTATAVDLGFTRGVRVVHGGRLSTNTRVVFVHGFEMDGGNSCNGTWGDMLDALRDTGWVNTFVVASYYADDTACDSAGRTPLANLNISNYGNHDAHFSSGHVTRDGVIVGHSTDARIRHLAYHWAWMVYDQYTRNLQPVKAVGHSMGGLIMRYAIHKVQTGDPEFPPRLVVEDVVTLGTPHTGAGFANLCAITHEQCRDLRPDSDFLNYLDDNAQNPQGDGGTEWTAIGAHDDDSVTAGSATNMTALEELQFASGQGIEHGEYMHLKLGSDLLDFDARADIWRYGKQCAGTASFWPVTVTHLALGNLVDDNC